MRQTKIEIVPIIVPKAIDMERAQQRARELQAEGKRIVSIEAKDVPQPTLAYITYEEDVPEQAETNETKQLKGDEKP
jgi:hypothetical protein